MQDKTEEFAGVHLGKKSMGSETYDSSLLVAVPRCENRRQYDIQNDSLPFEGVDVWHAYEFSAMTQNGIPVTRVIKLKYSCDNDYIIESKSLKLYFNSFNMSPFGASVSECLEICRKLIEKDLSAKLRTVVEAKFVDTNAPVVHIFKNFENIMNFVNDKELKIEHFKESPELLETELVEEKEYFLMFDSLRSNCRVTHQPDFGDVYIYYKSKKHIKEDSLVRYLSSFRAEYHFHEECCEMIYKRISDLLDNDDKLFVCALYTRRGGIDISPARWSRNCHIEDVFKLIDLDVFARSGIKQ